MAHTLADEIRRYVQDHHIRPARERGGSSVLVNARDVHDARGLENRFPAICGALDGPKFAEQASVTLTERQGPRQSSTAAWRFRV